jgi:hypothetical protein
VKDEDLDRCPRCKEDMWAGNALCRNCQREDELEGWPGGDGNPFADTGDQDEISPDYETAELVAAGIITKVGSVGGKCE